MPKVFFFPFSFLESVPKKEAWTKSLLANQERNDLMEELSLKAKAGREKETAQRHQPTFAQDAMPPPPSQKE